MSDFHNMELETFYLLFCWTFFIWWWICRHIHYNCCNFAMLQWQLLFSFDILSFRVLSFKI